MKLIFSVPTIFSAVMLSSPGWSAGMMDVSSGASASATAKASSNRVLTQVELKQRGEDALVRITGDGPLSYRIRALGTDRVIVDLINTSTKYPHALDFNNAIVRQIRIGEHPNLLRVVIDLQQPATYSVEEGKNTLSVTLAPRMSTRTLANTPLPAQDSKGQTAPRKESVMGAVVLDSKSATAGSPRPSTLESHQHDPTSTTQEARPELRRRAADRRMVDQPITQPQTETYVAAFGGMSLSQTFTNVHGVGANSSVSVSNLALSRSGIGGLKAGFIPSTAKWMAIETEVFYSSPHFKQQSVTVTGAGGSATGDFAGSHTRVATWALNWIVRYPGEWIQPYAGAGLGIFWGRLADSGGTSSSDVSPGLNALAGIRAKLGQHVLLFTEYKYNRASFDFSNSDFHVLYQAHYIVGGLGWSF